MTEPVPCALCGAIPEVDAGLEFIPGTAGYVSCRTIWSGQFPCPGHAESVDAWNAVMALPFILLPEEDRPDGMEVLAFHRGRWRHVSWSARFKSWILGYGGAFIRDDGRKFARLPEKPADAPGFFDFKEPI